MMAETKYSLEQDLREAQDMAAALVPYVYEDQLYGKIGKGGMFAASNTPALTLGAFLMRLRRLRALQDRMTDSQRATLAEIEAQNENVRKEWTLHFSNKLVQEANARLKQLNQYFLDCREDPRACANAYLPEALRRTILQEIADAMDHYNMLSDDLKTAVRSADSGLRRWTAPAEFIWDAALQPIYPQNIFWWLYAKPPQAGKARG
jgi:hypothetical protein